MPEHRESGGDGTLRFAAKGGANAYGPGRLLARLGLLELSKTIDRTSARRSGLAHSLLRGSLELWSAVGRPLDRCPPHRKTPQGRLPRLLIKLCGQLSPAGASRANVASCLRLWLRPSPLPRCLESHLDAQTVSARFRLRHVLIVLGNSRFYFNHLYLSRAHVVLVDGRGGRRWAF